MVSKKDILEIKRRFKKEEAAIQRLAGCYVDSSRNKVVTFNQTFLSLDEEEFYKYLDIARKVFSGTMGNNILELSFPNSIVEGDNMQQFYLGLRESEIKNEDLLNALYDKIIDNYDYAGNYLILVYYDVYDVPLKTSDNMKLDESEEVFPYILTAICPVKLSKPGLGYLPDDNRIGPRIRDWIVDMPDVGFMFPSFAERSADVNTVTYYVRDPKDSKPEFVESVLGTDSKRTTTENRQTFHAIIKRAIAPVEGENEELLINIQENLQNAVSESDDFFEEDTTPLTTKIIAQALSEAKVSDEISKQIQDNFEAEFADEESIPTVCSVIDEKKITAAKKEKIEETLNSQIADLQKELVEKTFEAVANSTDANEASKSGFSQSYDVILRVKPDKVPLIHTDTVDGERVMVIPLSEDEYVNLNGINTKL